MSRPLPCPPPAAAPLTLFCLPHAGGSALPYGRWQDGLPAGVRVVPLELPGHGARLREPLLDSVESLVGDLARAVRDAAPARYAVFGHSLGALLGYELARTLVAAGHRPPAALLVAGRNAPGEPLSHRPIHTLPDQALVAALERLGGMPRSVLSRPELVRAYLPLLRADLRIAETYERRPGPPADFPIAVFAGRADPLTDPPAVLGWARETTGAFELTLLPGGHFFLDGTDFLPALAGRLSRLSPLPPLSPLSPRDEPQPVRTAGTGTGESYPAADVTGDPGATGASTTPVRYR